MLPTHVYEDRGDRNGWNDHRSRRHAHNSRADEGIDDDVTPHTSTDDAVHMMPMVGPATMDAADHAGVGGGRGQRQRRHKSECSHDLTDAMGELSHDFFLLIVRIRIDQTSLLVRP